METTPHDTTQAHFEDADGPRIEECDFDGTNPPPEEDDPAVTDQPVGF